MRFVEARERAWFKYPQDETFEVELRRMPVTAVDKLKRRCRPVNAIDPDEVVIERWIEVIAEHFIVDWRGLVSENGEEMSYSKKTAEKVLQQNIPLMTWIAETATDTDRFFGNAIVSGKADS